MNVEGNQSKMLSPPLNSNLKTSNTNFKNERNLETPKNLLLKSNVFQKSDVGGLTRNRLEEGRGRI